MSFNLVPRDYQDQAVKSVFKWFSNNQTGNPLIVMPPGTGKSVVIALFLYRVFKKYPNQKVLIATHVKELIKQNYEKITGLWPQSPSGIYSAGLRRRDKFNRIIFCGIQSVYNKPDQFGKVDLLIVDESHRVNPKVETAYVKLIKGLMKENPNLRVIGLTATPWRVGYGHIVSDDGIFTDVCFDLSDTKAFNWLVQQGYLVPIVSKRTDAFLSTEGVKIRGGEFVQKQLQEVVDDDLLTLAALEEAVRLGKDRHHWIVFGTGIDHILNIERILNSLGVSAIAVHSRLDNAERDRRIFDFKNGVYQAIINVDMLTTGFDFPAVDLLVILRPTMSVPLWVQILGRLLRPVYAPGFDLTTQEGRLEAIHASQKENGMVLDFARNTESLGQINDPAPVRRKGQKSSEGRASAPVKVCDSCGSYNHASVRECKDCGYEFPRDLKIDVEASTADVVKQEEPIIEDVEVHTVEYAVHRKINRPPMVKVTYRCGLSFFTQYLGFQHPTRGAVSKAKNWWKKHTDKDVPKTTADAMKEIDKLRVPTHIRVITNSAWPEVISHCFDGTCFSKNKPSEKMPRVRKV